MANFPPIVTTLSNPAIGVTSVSDLSYDTLNASIGASVYRFSNLYQYSSTLAQLLEPVYFKKFNKFGDKEVCYLNMTIDPYQFTAALNQNVFDMEYSFDGNNSLIPKILANTSIDYRLDIIDLERSDLLKGYGNFGNLDFFSDYEYDF